MFSDNTESAVRNTNVDNLGGVRAGMNIEGNPWFGESAMLVGFKKGLQGCFRRPVK